MTCERCGRDAPCEKVSFHQHVGLVVLWVHRRYAGHYCRSCVGELFRKTTLITGLLGWWGVVSFFITLLFALPVNVTSYLRGRRLPWPGPDATARFQPHRRALRFDSAALTLGIWSVLHLAVTGGLIGLFIALGPMNEVLPYWALPLCILGPDVLLTLVYAALAMRGVWRVAEGTKGRARLLVLAWAAIVRALGMAVSTGVLAFAMTDPGAITFGLGAEQALPLGARGLWDSLAMVTTSQGTWLVLLGSLIATGLALSVELGAAVVTWFLLPKRFRASFWAVLDLVLLFAFVAVTLLLPLEPPESAPDAITLPVIRLAVTTFFVVRLLWRVLPFILDGIERLGFRLLVASRMLRARKSGFLTAIGALSILAVSFSSCTLTTTLSVMGGFRNDLKSKILGNHAHVVIDREHGSFEGWGPMLETVRANDQVIGASPYVHGEVMITSATNLSGAFLRGIDPATVGDVTDLPRNIRHGQLEYLSEPERLLRLRADEMGRNLLAPSVRDSEPPPPPIPGGGFLDEARDILGQSGIEAPRDPETARIAGEIDSFLLPSEEAEPKDEPRADVLPGLVVGQELARTLRLHVGDTVDVVSPFGDLGPTGPIPKSRQFRVAGIFYSGMYEFDMKMAYTTVEDAQAFLDVGDAIHGIEVKVRNSERAEPVAQALASALERPDLRVRAWQEVNRNLFGALQLEKLAMFIVLGLAILVASFCVVASLTLMVQEKGKEVGIFKAMGASAEQIVAIFMAQGLMIGLLGATLGLGLGYLTCFAAEHFGIPISAEVYYIDKLPVHVDGVEFALVGVSAVVICLLATIYPAILGSRLRPVDALRYS